MHSILSQAVLLRSAIFQNRSALLCVIAGGIVIAVLTLILIMLRRQNSNEAVSTNVTDGKQPSDRWPDENYRFITERIKQVEKKYKSIMFASVKTASLPVTIPVNAAIGLAKDKSRCLLIDLDLRRDAIARVFGLDSDVGGLRPRAVKTEFENLWVWPGHNFAQVKQMNIKMIAEKALESFDFVLINAPSLIKSPDRRQIISAAQAAFICTKDASEATKLAELIKPSQCLVIGHIQIPS